ncbi:hypothetical protein C8R42DRAFT_648106 [Lentinula raphanica]|nr:hypothetical protein C8R42DRAFT_648106 [Lentinula raphanica]
MRLSTVSLVIVVFGLFSTATVHSVPIVSLEARRAQAANYPGRDWSLLTDKAKTRLKKRVQKFPTKQLSAGFRRSEKSSWDETTAHVQVSAEDWVKNWLVQEFGPEVVSEMHLQFEPSSYNLGVLVYTLEFFLCDSRTQRKLFIGAVSTAEKEEDGYIVGAMAAIETDPVATKFPQSPEYPTPQDLIKIRESHRAASQGLSCSSSMTILISCKN